MPSSNTGSAESASAAAERDSGVEAGLAAGLALASDLACDLALAAGARFGWVFNGVCANTWPPFNAPADAKPSGDWSIVTRKDGSKQWAYKGKALYSYYHDGDPGDAKGDGVNNVWHVAAP